MKLYLIPIQNACNADCFYCITKHRNNKCFGEQLNLKHLNKLNKLPINKIEITGGGEPLLHPQINQIINQAAIKAPIQLYTNGALLKKINPFTIKKLKEVCLSLSHHNSEINKSIMGIERDDKYLSKISKVLPIKLSLVLCQSGISNISSLLNYINWGKQVLNVRKIVVRQMFDFDYPPKIEKEKISTSKIFDLLKNKYKERELIKGNPVLLINNVEVEFEYRTCPCQMENLVLRPNGKIYRGWENKEYENN